MKILHTASALVDTLKTLSGDHEAIDKTLRTIQITAEAFKGYDHFSDTYYARNLIHIDDAIQLILLCWEPGQTTPYHDHAGSGCWMLNVQGSVHEEIVTVSDEKLEPVSEQIYQANQLAHINDTIGWHKITNIGKSRAMTLHVYAPPITECTYICPEDLQQRVRELCYYSVNGEITADYIAECS